MTGGTGIAHSISILLSALSAPATRPRRTRRIHLIWHTRSAKDLRWIDPLLERAAKVYEPLHDLVVVIDVHVTRGSGQVESGPLLRERLSGGSGDEETPFLALSRYTTASYATHSSSAILLRIRRGRANLFETIHQNRESACGPLLVSGEHACCTSPDDSLWPCIIDIILPSSCADRHFR